jgi:hypothetical protein
MWSSRRPLAAISFLIATFCVLPLGAHHFEVDHVVLRPVIAEAVLRGELTLDPEHTRARNVAPVAAHEAALRELVETQLRIEVDGQSLPLNPSVRELWREGGATGGDLLVFSTPLPAGARSLRVFAGATFQRLIVSVRVPTQSSRAQTHSWLLGSLEWTPPYPLAGQLPSSWKPGDGEALLASGPPARGGDGAPSTGAGSVVRPITPTAPGALAARYLRFGFEHILPSGIDHLAFVAALVLGIGRSAKPLILALSSFTLAHTLTLALAYAGVFRVPAGVVEPLIALSICVLGLDNLRSRASAGGFSLARQLAVFAFGLVHGLGFASGFADLGLGAQEGHWLLALLAFNAGVELGQLCLAIPLFLVLLALRPEAARRYVLFPGSLAIAAAGLWLFVERIR